MTTFVARALTVVIVAALVAGLVISLGGPAKKPHVPGAIYEDE